MHNQSALDKQLVAAAVRLICCRCQVTFAQNALIRLESSLMAQLWHLSCKVSEQTLTR